MSARIARSEGSTENEVDGIRMSAKNALDHYLALPVVEDTFVFWKNYAVTTDKAQKCLCKLARLYLTPPPTTTGIYLWKLVIFVMLALSMAMSAFTLQLLYTSSSTGCDGDVYNCFYNLFPIFFEH